MTIRRCTRCIVPSTYSGVTFDEKGICSVCREWDSIWKGRNFDNGREEFLKHFAEKQGKYDCIVPFSGGKDSSYILYYLKRILGLNPLAVNLNNYFQTDIIKENIDRVIKALGAEMITFWPEFHTWIELMRRSFMKCTIPCLPCDVAIYALAYRSAIETNTRVVVFPGGKLAAPKKHGRALVMYKTLEMVARHFDQDIDLSSFAVTQEWVDRVNVVYFGEYFDWREDEILRVVVEELGWQKKGEQHARIDCVFEPILNYLYSQRAKMSKQCSRLSAMVRDGQITRDEALARDRNYMIDEMPAEFENVMARIDLPLVQIDHQVRGEGLMKPLWYH